MVMSWIWVLMLVLSVLFGLLDRTTAAVGAAALTGAQKGVELAVSLAGAICLWSALARLAETGGIAAKLTGLLRPLLRRLFPNACRDEQAAHALCGNFAANLLGLGNAATPMGIAAVRRMQTLSGTASATDEMCRLIVLNTASVQILPTTVAALRTSMGAAHPFDILPAVWLTSLFSVGCGLLAARLLQTRWSS